MESKKIMKFKKLFFFAIASVKLSMKKFFHKPLDAIYSFANLQNSGSNNFSDDIVLYQIALP